MVSSDGATLYVAAFGSSKVGVFATADLEDDTLFDDAGAEFDPTVEIELEHLFAFDLHRGAEGLDAVFGPAEVVVVETGTVGAAFSRVVFNDDDEDLSDLW